MTPEGHEAPGQDPGRERAPTSGVSRRSFLIGGAALGGAALAGGGFAVGRSSGGDGGTGPSDVSLRYVDFYGEHQTGIVAEPHPARGVAAAFDLQARDRSELREMFRDLTDEIQGLMSGRSPATRDPAFPPTDSGILGAEPPADNLAVIVSVGSSMFDDRYGLAGRTPRELVEMPFLANDRLDRDRSHGDVLLTIESENPDTAIFALRQLMRRTRRTLVLRWLLDGFNRRSSRTAATTASPRNLMGFKDGTANLDPRERAQMDRFVWVGPGQGEPAWTVGGSYHVVRVIRMFVEFWDRTPLAEQEAIMGRHRNSGAPLGMLNETDEPDFAADPDGTTTPLDAHIRLANPRTPAAREQQILRRGFSYSRGFDRAGRLDQGLCFVCYQKSISSGFLAIQNRLSGEPLEEYILPEGGGYYFALPGVAREGEYLAQGLFEGGR